MHNAKPGDAGQDLTQISLGKFRVGITGLKAAIEEIKLFKDQSEEEIAQALLERLRPKNYIPASVQAEYRQAFLREFKKAMGEKVEEPSSGLCIKILGPGCPPCDNLERAVMEVLVDLSLPAQVEHIRDAKEIARLRVFGTPGLIINDEVKAVGQTPTKGMLRRWLVKAGQKK